MPRAQMFPNGTSHHSLTPTYFLLLGLFLLLLVALHNVTLLIFFFNLFLSLLTSSNYGKAILA